MVFSTHIHMCTLAVFWHAETLRVSLSLSLILFLAHSPCQHNETQHKEQHIENSMLPAGFNCPFLPTGDAQPGPLGAVWPADDSPRERKSTTAICALCVRLAQENKHLKRKQSSVRIIHLKEQYSFIVPQLL